MDYLQTTGDRLHDLELDRILSRLRALEAASAAVDTTPPATTQNTVQTVSYGVRSLTPGAGTPMQGDVALAVAGSLSIAQSAQTITLTAPVLVAGANITLTTAGGSITIAASGGGGSGVPADVLTISPGGSAISWAMPNAVTEIFGSIINRAQHDLTNATHARLVLLLPTPNIVLPLPYTPGLAAQYSANGGATWASLDGAGGPSLAYGAGAVVSGWVSLAAGAQADVLLRVVASGGDGATSLPFGAIYLQVK